MLRQGTFFTEDIGSSYPELNILVVALHLVRTKNASLVMSHVALLGQQR